MNYLEYQEYQDYLCHHGVKGMKWGVRRYQNKDGSLTAAGKKRLSENAGSYMNPSKNAKNTKHRKAVENEYTDSFNKLMKKYNIDAETMDGAEIHRELGKQGAYYKGDKLWNSFIDRYSTATLKDLKIKDTPETREYVKKLFEQDLVKIPTATSPSKKELESLEKFRQELHRKDEIADKRAEEARAEVNRKEYSSFEAKRKAIDDVFKKKIREAEQEGDDHIADRIWDQWGFAVDELYMEYNKK